MSPSFRTPTRARGFSLLEILIAVLVLSVGVLGLAGLQVLGLKEGQTSYQRSQAILLAYEMADRIRANRVAAAAGNYVLSASTGAAAAATDCKSSSTICSFAEMAAYDLRDWDQRVRNGLPTGRASIACIGGCAIGKRQQISVMWDENRTGATTTNCGNIDLTCFTVNVTP